MSLLLATLAVTACATPEWPPDPPVVHDAKQELEQAGRSVRPESLLREPRLAGCYAVTLTHSGGTFPYPWIPDVVELTKNGATRCCGFGSGWYSVGWNEDSRAQFLGGQWSEETNGNVHVSFGYGGILAFRLRRAGMRLVGSATNDSPNREHDKVHPPVTLSPVPCAGRKFHYEPAFSGY